MIQNIVDEDEVFKQWNQISFIKKLVCTKNPSQFSTIVLNQAHEKEYAQNKEKTAL